MLFLIVSDIRANLFQNRDELFELGQGASGGGEGAIDKIDECILVVAGFAQVNPDLAESRANPVTLAFLIEVIWDASHRKGLQITVDGSLGAFQLLGDAFGGALTIALHDLQHSQHSRESFTLSCPTVGVGSFLCHEDDRFRMPKALNDGLSCGYPREDKSVIRRLTLVSKQSFSLMALTPMGQSADRNFWCLK